MYDVQRNYKNTMYKKALFIITLSITLLLQTACDSAQTADNNSFSEQYGSFFANSFTSDRYGFSLTIPVPYTFQYYAKHIWGNPEDNKENGGQCYLLSKNGLRIGQLCLTINPKNLDLEAWSKLNYDDKEGSEIVVQGKNNLYVFDFEFDDERFEEYRESVQSEVLDSLTFFDI